MPYIDFICLAASIREGGMCYAGKEVGTGRWVRPITSTAQPEIAHIHKIYRPGEYAAIGDVIRCPNLGAAPDEWQTENFIRGTQRWTKAGQANYAQISALRDNPATLWSTGSHSQGGQNDRVSLAVAANMNHSLLLVEASNIALRAIARPGKTPKQRVAFNYNGFRYDFSMTDPSMNLQAGQQRQIPEALVCCSLTHRWTHDGTTDPFVYKVVAGIIPVGRLP